MATLQSSLEKTNNIKSYRKKKLRRWDKYWRRNERRWIEKFLNATTDELSVLLPRLRKDLSKLEGFHEPLLHTKREDV